MAYEIKDDDEVRNELSCLNASFGIGVIELKGEKVIFEARKRELDIETLDMLVQKNGDFKEFMENVNKNIKVYLEVGDSELITKECDEILSDEKLEAHKKQCGIE